jgi:hypothetical protein
MMMTLLQISISKNKQVATTNVVHANRIILMSRCDGGAPLGPDFIIGRAAAVGHACRLRDGQCVEVAAGDVSEQQFGG